MRNFLLLSTAAIVLAFTACTKSYSENTLGEVSSEKVIESSVSWNGDSLPNYPEGTPKVTVLRITIPPHAKLDMHKHPIINVGVLIKGSLTVNSEDGEVNTINAGDGIVELVNKYHFGENTGDTPAELIVFYAGDETSPLSINK